MPCSTTNTPWLPWRGPCAGVLPSWLPFSKPKPSLLPSAWQEGEWECAQKHLQARISIEHQQDTTPSINRMITCATGQFTCALCSLERSLTCRQAHWSPTLVLPMLPCRLEISLFRPKDLLLRCQSSSSGVGRQITSPVQVGAQA